jgi:hypothetical protein
MVDTAFQEDAFQGDAFQIDVAVVTVPVYALGTGHLVIGRFQGEPQYTLNNEIISHEQIDEGRLRSNVVIVDGLEHSWTEYDRADLVARDAAVNRYLDLPELKTPGEVRQRAVEEMQQARVTSSPGGVISGSRVVTTRRMDAIFWIDEHGNKYQTRIEGKRVEFNQSVTPFQRATIDTGALIFCPPDDGVEDYLARDTFDRASTSGLGEADLGGVWVIIT